MEGEIRKMGGERKNEEVTGREGKILGRGGKDEG